MWGGVRSYLKGSSVVPSLDCPICAPNDLFLTWLSQRTGNSITDSSFRLQVPIPDQLTWPCTCASNFKMATRQRSQVVYLQIHNLWISPSADPWWQQPPRCLQTPRSISWDLSRLCDKGDLPQRSWWTWCLSVPSASFVDVRLKRSPGSCGAR